MSIAVMNWVWANSPTSGNERLVLLALADACSRDDGTGCWPSAATIARKSNISARTVRRVIARLEADGHVVVHRGGGRAGSTNSYTVVTSIRSPGQNDTSDKLSGGVTGDRPPRTQCCQGSPDTAVSADPPGNHKGTAAAQARDVPVTRPFARQGGPEVEEFFNHLAARSPRWLLTEGQRKRLTPAVIKALAARWTPDELAGFVGASSFGIRNPFAVLVARLARAELPQPRTSRRPPWCGECDERTRMLDFDGDSPRPCPRCKATRHSSDALQKRRSPDDTCGTRTGIPCPHASSFQNADIRLEGSGPVEHLTLQETEGDKKLRTELGA